MARPIATPPPSHGRDFAVLGVLAALVVLGIAALSGIVVLGGPPKPDGSPPDEAARLPGNGTGPLHTPSSATASTGPASAATGQGSMSTDPNGSIDFPTPIATPTPTPSPSPVVGAAPTSPETFDVQGQVIPMGFPLRRDTRYRYHDNFLDIRDGPPDAYNHARLRDDGTEVRLHDGADIYAKLGEPLLAVFDGTVIDPSTVWQPWEPARYGHAIVIRSDDPRTHGYMALYAHAARVWVEPGTKVTRGQVIGTIGRTGNAELQSIHPHLHFELRAPFMLDWAALGEHRQLDAFNPYPSLRAADPKRS